MWTFEGRYDKKFMLAGGKDHSFEMDKRFKGVIILSDDHDGLYKQIAPYDTWEWEALDPNVRQLTLTINDVITMTGTGGINADMGVEAVREVVANVAAYTTAKYAVPPIAHVDLLGVGSTPVEQTEGGEDGTAWMPEEGWRLKLRAVDRMQKKVPLSSGGSRWIKYGLVLKVELVDEL